MLSRKKLIFIGDSLLDNFKCLSNRQKDLRKELIDMGYFVNNFAVSDAKLEDIIHGIEVKETENEKMRYEIRSYPYSREQDDKVHQLKLLKERNKNRNFTSVYGDISINSFTSSIGGNNNEMIIISGGGNDFRIGPTRIINGLDYLFNSVVDQTFINNYNFIIQEVLGECPKALIVCMYLPYMGPGSIYGIFIPFADKFMSYWYGFLKNLAKNHNIPILDLSRTMDNTNPKHYGKGNLDPSEFANKCLADCISYIYDNYDGFHEYYAPNCDISNIQKN